ncbi:MAG: cobalamin-dependent protein [Bryobacteraceae bacterium]
MADLEHLYDAILTGNAKAALAITQMLQGGGFEVHDLGADVTPQKFIDAVRDHKTDIVPLSALLTVTMPAMKTTVEAFRGAGIRENVKIIVGGAPVTAHFAAEIGADGYSESATAPVSLARRLVGAN